VSRKSRKGRSANTHTRRDQPKRSNPQGTRQQDKVRAFRVAWTLFVVAATSAPYLFNWLTAPAGYHYTWIIPPYPEDSFGYMAWAQQAAHGAWLFKIKYTALPHSPFLFHPFFLLCGWISALLSCDVAIVFWIAKAIGAGVFLITFYRYVDYLGLSRFQATVASILVGISSGFGAFFALVGWVTPSALGPSDLWMPEVSIFSSLSWNPLFAFSLIFMLLAVYWLDRGTGEKRMRDLWLSGLATGVMTLIHPYALPLLFALAAAVALIRHKLKATPYLLRYFAAALPFAIYLALVSKLNPLVAKHTVLGVMPSPPLIMHVLGFGLPLLLCLGGLIVAPQTLLKRYGQLILWFLLSLGLAYAPFWFQRKLIFGAQIPLCILAAIAFEALLTKWAPVHRRWFALGTAVILLPMAAATPLYLTIKQRAEVKANAQEAYLLSDEVMEGLTVLKQQSKPNDVVFASPHSSRLIAALSGNTTVWGHWAMAVDRKERMSWFQNLFTIVSDQNRSEEFWSNDIQFIFADGELKQGVEQSPFGWGPIIRDARKIFQNGSVVIYQRPQSQNTNR
jgi:hypothetical protein